MKRRVLVSKLTGAKEEGRFLCGAASPKRSLARTSYRTRNCGRRGNWIGEHAEQIVETRDVHLGSEVERGATAMDVIYPRCAGLDVHQKSVMVCLRIWTDGKSRKTVRRFGTMTHDLVAMAEWLGGEGVTHVAMESTGVFWKPIYNILEGRFEVLLCNARDVKQVPGRKTDVKDCEWLAQLLQHGLLRGSFVPARELRQLRDLTRGRAQLVGERTRTANRIHKVLEDANIKLGAVATDVLGASGRRMIQAMVAGETDANVLSELAQKQLRAKIPELRLALQGHLTDHHRFMLRFYMEQLQRLDHATTELSERIETTMAEADRAHAGETDIIPFAEAVNLVMSIPGIDRRTAQNEIAEIGTDMGQFPDRGHLASWTGICPGNNESAGRRKSGTTPKGNRWLRRALSQAAAGAARTKNSYLKARYGRLARRRGKKRALIAVAHTLLVVTYHVLRERKPYFELGPGYLDQRNPERLTRYLVRRLESLGHKVTLQAA